MNKFTTILIAVLLICSPLTASSLTFYERMNVIHARALDSIPDYAVVFYGDSIAQSLYCNSITPHCANLGIGGDTAQGVANRINSKLAIRVRAVVVAVGVNDIRSNTNSEIIAQYQRIMNKLQNARKVVWSGILPVDNELCPGIPNERILDVNAEAQTLCEAMGNCVYVETGKQMRDASGNLDDKYQLDCVHINTTGYKIMAYELRHVLFSRGR